MYIEGMLAFFHAKADLGGVNPRCHLTLIGHHKIPFRQKRNPLVLIGAVPLHGQLLRNQLAGIGEFLGYDFRIQLGCLVIARYFIQKILWQVNACKMQTQNQDNANTDNR